MLRRTLISLTIGLVLTTARPAQAQTSDRVVYYHHDAIGSVRVVTDQNGQVVGGRYDYTPFGEPYSTPTSPDSRQFAGLERDNETGADYFGARYYQNQTGRFTTADPVIGVERALMEPQLWNRYVYVTNNPLRYKDSDGRQRDALDEDVRALLAKQITVEEYNARIQARGFGTALGALVVAGPTVWRAAVGCFLSPSCQSSALDILEGAAGGPPRVAHTGTIRSSGEIGQIIGWGTGQAAEEVAQTVRVTRELTAARVAELVKQGVSREWVEKQLAFYRASLESGSRKLENNQLLPRIELMEKLLKLWPEQR
jgi:RHS repeat-associated protein